MSNNKPNVVLDHGFWRGGTMYQNSPNQRFWRDPHRPKQSPAFMRKGSQSRPKRLDADCLPNRD
jgi:hypothetical protein